VKPPRAAPVVAVLGIGVAVAAAVAYAQRVEPWLRRWGATDAECRASLAVDDLVGPGVRSITRAITVHAPVEAVWPWLIQIGQDRAGFYSYSSLENLVGARMHNASYVHPDWQQREPGESVWLADPRRWGDRGRQIAALVEPPHALVLVSPEDWSRLERGERSTGAWAFFLQPHGANCTRFVVRSSGGAVGDHVFDAVHFVMEQKMMRGLRDRAESQTR